MIIAILIVLGLAFGSFTNAFVWRLHQQNLPKKKRKASDAALSLSKGRSMCVDCGHTLSALDLLPVVSWLGLRGKCRYCKRPISWQYPLVELLTATLFVMSYLFWPYELDTAGTMLLVVWLVNIVGLVSLVIYDIRWMLLPNKIIFPLLGLSGTAVIADALLSGSQQPIGEAVVGVLIGGGIFWILFQVSNGKWIGGGDVKLGFLLGLLVGGPLGAFLLIFLASLLGTLVTLPLLLSKRVGSKTRIPFGPFLIVAAVIVKLSGDIIFHSYLRFIGVE